MHAKNFFINQSCDWEAIETICENFPKLDAVATLALIVKSINAIDRGTLMVSSQKEEVFWVLDFVGK